MNWNIEDIRRLTEEEAKKYAIEAMEIKGHTIYFVDFEGGFGYSCLVFKNNHSIHYANDYGLHHMWETREKLREIYIEKMNSILFTESELQKPLENYDDYKRRVYYLHNYYGMQVDHVSSFGIITTKEQEKEYKEKIKGMVYNKVAFSYMHDANFVKRHVELAEKLEELKNNMQGDYEYYKKAFLYEMYNHEYWINLEPDYDTLSAFGNIQYQGDNLNGYFDQLGFTEVQRKAYLDARRQYCKEQNS